MIGEGIATKCEEGEGDFFLDTPLLHLDPEFGVVLDVIGEAGDIEDIHY